MLMSIAVTVLTKRLAKSGTFYQIIRTLGSLDPSNISSVNAQTSASSRSGLRPDDNPFGPKSQS